MIHVVDTHHLGRPHIVAAHLLQLADGLAIIDGGADRGFDHLVEGIRALGRKPEDVRHLLLTHIHLDHAGGAWRWAREFGTEVYVHPRGAAHLRDPSKLVASATRIYGERMEALWGRIEPVPAGRLHVIEDGERLPWADGPEVRAVETPGHAPHHHAYWMPAERTLFAGDVAGVIIHDGPVAPPCPPPDVDVETWCASLQRLRALAPAAIYVTHFGRLPDPLGALDALGARLVSWAGWVRDRLREGREEGTLGGEFAAFVAGEFRAAGLSEEQIEDYQQADPASINIAGLARYWRKHRADALA